MEPAEPEKLLEAFHVLDPENRGTLTKDYFGKLMMEEGEPFTQEELDEMMAVAIDPLTGLIPYEFYLNQLMVILIVINKNYFVLHFYFFLLYCTVKYRASN